MFGMKAMCKKLGPPLPNGSSQNLINFKIQQWVYPLCLCEFDDRSILCHSCPDYEFCNGVEEDSKRRDIYE